MEFATKGDMIDRFGEQELIQLTDRSNPRADVVGEAVLAGALGDANEEVAASVGAKYSLPLAAIPAVLVRVACDLARYFLYDVKAPEEVRNRAQDARALLKAIAAGTASLGLDTASQPSTQDIPSVQPGNVRTWDHDSLEDY